MKKKKSVYQLLFYILGSSPKIKKFKTKQEMSDFIDDFNKKYPNWMSLDSDNWIDYVVTDVHGKVHFYTDGLKVE